MAKDTRQRRRIPHCRLMLAGNVKSGFKVWHRKAWRSVHRAFFDGRDVFLYFSNGVGSMSRITARYDPRDRVAVRITIREARIKKQVA